MTPKGEDPVGTVAGVVGVKTPVLELMVYIETESSIWFATYANRLEGSTVTELGLHPVATEGGVVGVKSPVLESMVNIETVLSSLFAV